MGMFALALSATPAQADCLAPPPRSLAGEIRKEIVAACAPVPPVIDGVMDEGVWEIATVITDFEQVDPVEGGIPSERTEVRILYDKDALYLFLRAYESDPENIVASIMERDGDIQWDDRFVVVLDTFGDGLDGFIFIVNALGTRRDILAENNSVAFPNWDAIWYAKSQIDDEGWTAEIAIPMKSLSFNKGPNEWGFNISRRLVGRNEEIRWSNIRQDLPNRNVSQIGRLKGLEDLDQGLGLDVKVAGAVGYLDDDFTGQEGFQIDPSVDVFYRITPSITGALTYNTDFAEAAVDERKVNLTRFSLFFPETRDFFLQDVGVFEFADLDNFDINGRPFFTRRIGLTSQGIVDIIGGGKVTGQTGPVNFGLMSVQTDQSDRLGLDSENLSVGRVSVNVLEESNVGAIFTHGNPESGPGNSTYGVDFNFQDNSFRGRAQSLKANAWILRADTDGIGSGEYAFGGKVGTYSDRFDVTLRAKEIGPNYNPALGFANRLDIREYKGLTRLRWRPNTLVRTIDWQEYIGIVTDRDNNLESLRFNSELKWTNNRGDDLRVSVAYEEEHLNQTFFLPKGLTIPPGDYSHIRPEIAAGLTRSRPFSVFAKVSWGDYFNGESFAFDSAIDYKPSPYFFFSLRYNHTEIDLPSGEGLIRIAAFEFKLNLTPDMQWANIIQYDNVTGNVGLNSRFRWIITPGSEFYFVINQDALARDWNLRSQRSEAVFKLGHTFRL